MIDKREVNFLIHKSKITKGNLIYQGLFGQAVEVEFEITNSKIVVGVRTEGIYEIFIN